MKGSAIFFVGCVLMSFGMHGMKSVDEWMGIEKYWKPSTYHSDIYCHCIKYKNDHNCALINAYFLFLAQEKKYAKQQVQLDKKNLRAVKQEVVHKKDTDFIERRRLQEKEGVYRGFKNTSKNHLQRIVKQLKMGNLSKKTQDHDKQLEGAFNAIVTNTDYLSVQFELHCFEEAKKNAQSRTVPFKTKRRW